MSTNMRLPTKKKTIAPIDQSAKQNFTNPTAQINTNPLPKTDPSRNTTFDPGIQGRGFNPALNAQLGNVLNQPKPAPIDHNIAKAAANAARPTPPDPAKQSTPDYGFKFIRNDMRDAAGNFVPGKISGVQTPDGRSILGLSPNEALALASHYSNSYSAPPGTQFADIKNPPQLTQEQQIQAELDRAALKQRMIDQQSGANVSQDILNSIGQLSPQDQAIANGNANMPGTPGFNNVVDNVLRGTAVESINKGIGAGAGGAIAGVGAAALGAPLLPAAGVAIGVGALALTAKEVFTAYDQKDKSNFDSVQSEISTAQGNIRDAIKWANSGGDSAEVVAGYNNAIARLQLADRQLKSLEGDQNKYVDSIRQERTDLSMFMLHNLPVQNDKLRLALQKPDPKYAFTGYDENGNPQ